MVGKNAGKSNPEFNTRLEQLAEDYVAMLANPEGGGTEGGHLGFVFGVYFCLAFGLSS